MIVTADNVMLFIHPKSDKVAVPIDDDLSRRVLYALDNWAANVTQSNHCTVGHVPKNSKLAVILHDSSTLGVHTCKCGARSQSSDAEMKTLDPNMPLIYTNTLAAHYVRFHRQDITPEDIRKIQTLPVPPADFVPNYFLD